MITFFKTIYLSISSPQYYKELLEKKTRWSVLYYVVLSTIFITVNTIYTTPKVAQGIQNTFTGAAEYVRGVFPKDAYINITPTGISSNKEFPIVIPTPKSMPFTKNLVVFDPNGTVGMIKEYDTLIVINNNYVMTQSENGNVEVESLANIPEFTLDYALIDEIASIVIIIANNAYVIAAAFAIFIGTSLYFTLRVWYLMLFSFILKFIAKESANTYSKALRVSLHTITLPLIISAIADLTGAFPFGLTWFTFLHILCTFYVLKKTKEPVV